MNFRIFIQWYIMPHRKIEKCNPLLAVGFEFCKILCAIKNYNNCIKKKKLTTTGGTKENWLKILKCRKRTGDSSQLQFFKRYGKKQGKGTERAESREPRTPLAGPSGGKGKDRIQVWISCFCLISSYIVFHYLKVLNCTQYLVMKHNFYVTTWLWNISCAVLHMHKYMHTYD